MKEQDRAKEVWERACNRMLDELAVGDIASFGEAEYRRGVEAMLAKREDAFNRVVGWFSASPRPAVYDKDTWTLCLSLVSDALRDEAARLLGGLAVPRQRG